MATKQELQINTLEFMMEQNTKEHGELKDMIISFGDKLDRSLATMENKFAPMWVKSIIVWAGGIVGTFLILFALNQIFIK